MTASLDFPQSDIGNLCRTCLSRDSELYSIYEMYVDSVTLDHIITTVTGIKIKPNDELPKSICCECKESATNAFNFKKKSKKSDELLQSLLKSDSNNSNDLDDKDKMEMQTKLIDVKIEQICSDNDYDMDYASISGIHDDFNETEPIKQESHNEALDISLQCYICSKFLESEAALKKHLLNTCLKVECNEENTSFCPLCGTCFNSSATLTKHMWEKHADLMGPKKRGRPKNLKTTTIIRKLCKNGLQVNSVNLKKYGCSFCNKMFSSKDQLYEHVMTHKDNKVFCCPICKRMFMKYTKFENHICTENKNVKNEETEETSGELLADNNSGNFSTETSLSSLMSVDNNLDKIVIPQVCSLCSEIFLAHSDLAFHIDDQHPELSQRCNICLKMFASVKSASRHRSACKLIERKHQCSTCGLKFAYEISLNKHILRYHEGQSVSVNFIDPNYKLAEKKFQCDTCEKCFYRKDLLVKHTRVHSEKAFECEVCKKTFNRKDNLMSHRRTHEPRPEPKLNTCLCLYCGRSFNNSSNLTVHMRRHTGEKPYKCDFCDKGFPRSSDLQCHRRSHTGEKPCVCKVCGKGFSRSNKLSRHMRVHTGQKPYKCTYCEKAFSQSNDLTLHIRRHTGDKPYICEICGDRFIQGTALQNHRRAHGHFPTTSSQLNTQLLTETEKTLQFVNNDKLTI